MHGVAGVQGRKPPAQHRVVHARAVVERDVVVHAFLHRDIDDAVLDILRRQIGARQQIAAVLVVAGDAVGGGAQAVQVLFGARQVRQRRLQFVVAVDAVAGQREAPQGQPGAGRLAGRRRRGGRRGGIVQRRPRGPRRDGGRGAFDVAHRPAGVGNLGVGGGRRGGEQQAGQADAQAASGRWEGRGERRAWECGKRAGVRRGTGSERHERDTSPLGPILFLPDGPGREPCAGAGC
ncbi:hypothetical protein D9M72_474070 [compost metagenome]